jgi:hypothetical protein
VLHLSQGKLTDNERVQQTDLTRSLSQEIQFFESNLTQQLMSERQILTLAGLIDNVEDPISEPKVTRLLENFVDSNRTTFIYLTAVGRSGKGTSASQGNFRAEQDPFVAKALQRAFVTCMQSQQLNVVKFRSDPLALAPNNRPAFVIAVPLRDSGDQFTGMLAAVVSLDTILHRLQEASVRGRTVFVVDHYGHIVAHPDIKNFVPGADASGNSLVNQVTALPQDLRNTETVRFSEKEKNHIVEMIGTYSTFPEVNWAVIAERSLDQARSDAGMDELNRQALAFVSFVVLAAIGLGYFFAVGISGPIRGLADSTRAISRGEFHQRSPVQALLKSASWPKISTRWQAISRSTSSASRKPRKKTVNYLSAPSACSPRPSTKRTRTRAGTPVAWRNIPRWWARNWASPRRRWTRCAFPRYCMTWGKLA